MATIMGLMSLKQRLAFFAFLACAIFVASSFGAWQGYTHGYAVATTKGEALLAKEKESRAEENTARALALAKAESDARTKAENAYKYASNLEIQLATEQQNRATERAKLTRRIHDVSQNAAGFCAGLPAEWVYEFRAATVGAGSGSLPANGGVSKPENAASASAGAGAGLLPEQPLTSPADLLSWARDYGEQCQSLRQKLLGWQQTYGQWTGE